MRKNEVCFSLRSGAVTEENRGPIDAKRNIAAGLRGSAKPRRLHTTDTHRRRASVVRQAVVFRFAFRFDSALTVLSGCVFRFP